MKRRPLVGLTLPYLAALVPEGWNIQLVDEHSGEVDFNAPVDIVAISIWTINSLRAYEIADRFRRRGVPVIMGGPHTCFHYEEVAEHCDAVGIGEGEEILPVMLEDSLHGRLEKIYRSDRLNDLSNLPLPRYDLLNLSSYNPVKTFSVQASRGCPFRCVFCSERFHLGSSYRFRPVDEIIEQIRKTPSRYIFFADSNFAGNLDHTVELLEALIPMRIRWSALWPAYLCADDRLMDLAVRSGLLHVNVGIESIDKETAEILSKKNGRLQQREVVRALRSRNISYSLNFIFGWDTETPGVFSSTLNFLRSEKVPAAFFNILTPHKGTPLFDRMQAEDRIINADQIGRWPGIHCYIKPTYCSPLEMERSVKEIYRDFYSTVSMLLRLPLVPSLSTAASWAINMSQRKASRSVDEMESFDGY